MTPLIAELVAKDPKIKAAKEEILKVMEKYRSQIAHVRPPQSERKQSYEETIKQFAQIRGMDLWYPYLGSGMGNGALVELGDGSVKYDFIDGIGVHFGHCHPEFISAVLDAALQNTVMQGHLQQNRDSFELSELLIKNSSQDHCILSTSGAMACENALKIIFQKKNPATRILAFERCFMGRTLALSQITDKPSFRDGLPINLFVDYLPFYDAQDPKGSTERALQMLRKYLKRYPKQYACFCFELIQGEAGFYPGSNEFFTALMQELKEREIAIFVDEVQTFARTDKLFAYEHFGLEKFVDVVTIGKIFQLSATLYKTAFKPKPGLIAQTYTASTASIRASIALLKALLTQGYLGAEGKNRKLSDHFRNHLIQIQKRLPDRIQGPFGYGLLFALTPFQGDSDKVVRCARALFEAGLICFTAGENPMRLRFHLPFGSVTFEDIDNASKILEETLWNLRF